MGVANTVVILQVHHNLQASFCTVNLWVYPKVQCTKRTYKYFSKLLKASVNILFSFKTNLSCVVLTAIVILYGVQKFSCKNIMP